MKIYDVFKTPVITLNDRDFAKACSELALKVCELDAPDLVVGILRGGDVVASKMVESGHLNKVPYVTIGYQRPSTAIKQKPLVSYVLKLIPRSVANLLRRIESSVREYQFNKKNCTPSNGKEPVCDTKAKSKILNSSRILVVDDAIDSGVTLLKAINLIKDINPNAQCYVAVLTETFQKPLLKADVSLFKQVLIRFPWSEDF